MFQFRLISLNFLLLLVLLFCVQKRINVQQNYSERAGKAFCCFNFLSILNLPINLNFVRARFEFDIPYMAKCLCSQNLELLIITFLYFFCTQKRINAKKKIKASVHMKPSVRYHSCCRLHLWLLVLQKLEKHEGTNFRLFQ